MQQSQPHAVQQSRNAFASASRRFDSSISHRDVSLALAGIFLLIVAVALYSIDNNTSNTNTQTLHAQDASSSGNTPSTTSATAQASVNESSGTDPPSYASHDQVTVNGQDVPIPAQGNTSRTVTSGNSKTTVSVSTQSSSQGSSESSTSNNLNVSVNSSSTSSAESTNN